VSCLRFTAILCAVGFCFVSSPAFVATDKTWVHATYRCSVKDVVRLEDNGHLGKAAGNYPKMMDGIIIDTLTGAITFPFYEGSDLSRQVWRVVQNGSAANDYVLIPKRNLNLPLFRKDIGDKDINDIGRAAATDFIRIRAWTENPQVTFISFGLSTLWSGTCEVVR
jgi:hypothetical protein